MMFRQEPTIGALRREHVIHGPFPVRWSVIGSAFVGLFLGVLFLLLSLHSEALRCDTENCAVNGKRAFSRSDIVRADVAIEKGSKGAEYGVVTLTLKRGTYRFMRVTPDEANEAASQIRNAQTSQTPIAIDFHEPRFLIVLGVLGLIAFVVLTVVGLRSMGRFDLIVTGNGQTLLVRRSVLAIPVGSREISLARVDGVVVERSTVTLLRGRNEAPLPAARLSLRRRDGERTPLSARFFPGHALHLRAAWALRNALEIDPYVADDTELAAIPMRTTPMGQRIAFAWVGLTTGSLFGLAIMGCTLLLFSRATLRDNIEGWMMAAGCIPGAIGGAAVVFHATRPRLPR